MRRHDFLRKLHAQLRPRNYLEIGVNDGRSLTLAACPTIAIDPDFKVTAPVRCDLQLVKATSDDFFAGKDPIRHLRSGRHPLKNARRGRPLFDHWRGGTTLDLAFIDGMHLFEYALRDFMNVERFSRATTVIVMDDMLPTRPVEALRGGNPDGWTGDVFKVALVLGELRPDLTLIPMDTEPTGVLVVLGADPTNRTLVEGYDEIVERWVEPDPQTVPDEILGRRHAVDPERFLASDVWSTLRGSRHGRGEAAAARVRETVDALRP
jgi:hypothetical protein